MVMLLSILFVLLFLPETNGRTLEQIQSYFETGQVLVGCCNFRKIKESIETGVNTGRASFANERVSFASRSKSSYT